MSKQMAAEWLRLAERLAHLEGDFRAKNIAICLASAYRQGWRDSQEADIQQGPFAAILLRTIAAEAERTGSWHVPPDLQERVRAWVAERDGRRTGASEGGKG